MLRPQPTWAHSSDPGEMVGGAEGTSRKQCCTTAEGITNQNQIKPHSSWLVKHTHIPILSTKSGFGRYRIGYLLYLKIVHVPPFCHTDQITIYRIGHPRLYDTIPRDLQEYCTLASHVAPLPAWDKRERPHQQTARSLLRYHDASTNVTHVNYYDSRYHLTRHLAAPKRHNLRHDTLR